jgi:hypothetical protein
MNFYFLWEAFSLKKMRLFSKSRGCLMKEKKIKNKKSRVFAGGHVKFTVQKKPFLKKFWAKQKAATT